MADVILCASSITGHVAPMLTIASHLHDAGHTVRMTTGSRFGDRVAATGVEFVPLRGAADIDDTNLDVAFPGRAQTRGIAKVRFDVSHLFIATMRPQWDVLSAELDRRTPDVVLYETGFTGVAPLVAGSADRPPVIGCGVIPLTLASPHVPPFGPGIRHGVGPVARVRNRALTTALHKVVFGQQQREAQAALAGCAPGARFSGFFMNGVARVDAFLQLSVPSLDYPRPDLPATISYIGPVLPATSGPIDLPTWWADLDRTRPVVLVTQGTIDTMDLDRLIGPTVRGLSGENVLVVVVTGGPPVERLGPLPPNVRAATFLPFDILMPNMSIMVTNGGFGGIHYALAHDVPLVVAGDTEDKPEIAARIAWAGAGINLRTGTPTPDQVRDAVRTVLSHRSYLERAQSIGTEIRRSDALGSILAQVETQTAYRGHS